MKKYWWILVLFVLVLGGVAYLVFSDLNEEKKLIEEMNQVYELMDANNQAELEQKLNNIVTSGDYAIVEKAAKNYVKDFYNLIISIIDELDNEKITTLITYKNYQEDGPNFSSTKTYINTTKSKLENYKNLYKEFLTEEKAKSYLKEELDSYYQEFYIEQIIGKENDETIIADIDNIIEILNNSKVIIDFLVNYQDNWYLEDNYIYFTSEELTNQYDNLLNTLL